MQIERLTETAIEAIRPAPGAKAVTFRWEAGTGFGVMIKPSGAISYVVQVVVKPEAGKPYDRRVVIGPALGNRRVPLKEARRRAEELRIAGEKGADPSKRVARKKPSPKQPSAMPPPRPKTSVVRPRRGPK
jgi:Arm DNA-binding domain